MAEQILNRAELQNEQPAVRILCIGDEDILLESRVLVLRAAGYNVHSSGSRGAVEASLSTDFSCALICRSVPDKEAAALAGKLRTRNTSLQIIRLKVLASAAAATCYDAAIDSSRGPVEFLRSLKVLLRRGGPAGNTQKIITPDAGGDHGFTASA